MNSLRPLSGLIAALALAAALGVGAWWLVMQKAADPKTDKPPPAAKVDKVEKEEDFARVMVGEKAADRIGLAVGTVERKAVRRVRVYGGEVVIADGRRIPVNASLAGALEAPVNGMTKAGQSVKAGDPLFRLMPLLSPESRITMTATLATAEGAVKTAEKRLDAARVALDRARSAAAISGGRGPVEAAQGAFEVATEERGAAAANLKVLKAAVGELEKGIAAPLPVLAPISGILRTVSAQPGQAVANGAPLCEVVDLSTVWVRLPLPVGDAGEVALNEPAAVGRLAGRPPKPADEKGRSGEKPAAAAKRVQTPPSANPLAGTLDVFYELPNPAGEYLPGQRVGVTVPRTDPAESPTVPWSAVVLDIHGGYWVFVETAPRTFYRRRVLVEYTDPADPAVAVLDAEQGPKAGTRVAVTGVQELFGAETGFVK